MLKSFRRYCQTKLDTRMEWQTDSDSDTADSHQHSADELKKCWRWHSKVTVLSALFVQWWHWTQISEHSIVTWILFADNDYINLSGSTQMQKMWFVAFNWQTRVCLFLWNKTMCCTEIACLMCHSVSMCFWKKKKVGVAKSRIHIGISED